MYKADALSERVHEAIEKNGGQAHNILGILLDIQAGSQGGFIGKDTTELVAQELHMSATRVYEIASYYAMLEVSPQAKYRIEVCNSSPCYFSAADKVVEMLHEKLGIGLGQISDEKLFSLHYTPCVGACAQGPVIKIGDEVFGNLDKQEISRIVDNLRLKTTA